MKRYLLILFVSFCAGRSLAQSDPMENLPLPLLKKKLTDNKNDTGRIKLQIILGRVMINRSDADSLIIDSASRLANLAAKSSRNVSYDDGMIGSMLLSALCEFKQDQPDEGLKIARQALSISEKLKNYRGIAESYVVMANFYNHKRSDELQIKIGLKEKAIAIYRKINDQFRLASLLKENAELLYWAGNKTEALRLLFEALSISRTIGNRHVQGIYWLIARTSTDMGDNPHALKYNLLSIKTANENQDTTLQLCSIYNTTAATYLSMNDPHRAVSYGLLALSVARHFKDENYIGTVSFLLATAYSRTKDLPKALALLKEIENMVTDDSDRLFVVNNYLTNLVYAGDLKLAGMYARESEMLLAKMSAQHYTATSASNASLAAYYIRTGQYVRAKPHIDKYASYVYQNNLVTGIRTTELNYYKLDSANNDYRSAAKHYLAAQRVKDSTENITKAYQLSLLEIENETENKNMLISNLKQQAGVKDLQLKKNRFIRDITIGGMVFMLLIVILIHSRYRLKKRSNIMLSKQKTEIDQQNNGLRELINEKSILIGEKDELLTEKDLLLREVNHRIKNNLQIVMSLLDSQSGYLQNRKAADAIQESQRRVRSIALIHDQLFNNDMIAEIDLSSYVGDLVTSLDTSINDHFKNVRIGYEVDNILLDVSQAIPIGIILNEAVTNALKYAFPNGRNGEIMISVRRHENMIEMKISDNGIGLKGQAQYSRPMSLGNVLIKALTSQLGGVLTIYNDTGITVMIRFPVATMVLTHAKVA